MSDKIEISRRELYEQVWSEPMSKLAKRYGLSDVGLAKTCRRHNIPVPPRGYWARKKAGLNPRTVPLPPEKGESAIFIRSQAPTTEISIPEGLSMAKEAVQNSLLVPETLKDPHPLVVQTSTALSARKPDRDGLIAIVPDKVLDIRVSPKSQSRALRIFNTIVKALEGQGFKVSTSKSGTCAIIDGIAIYFGLREELRKTRKEPDERESRLRLFDSWEFVPSGKFVLTIKDPWVSGGRRNWRDGKRLIENNLGAFVSGLIDYAVLAKKEVEERLEWHRAREERRRQEEERRARIKAEQEKIQQMTRLVQNWHQSMLVRQFADAVEKKALDPNFRLPAIDDLGDWLAWIRHYADCIDPLSPCNSDAIGPE